MKSILRDITPAPQIIGFHGRIGDGKDEYFKRIEAQRTCHHVSFANPLKDAGMAVFGGERERYYGTQEEKAEVFEFWRDRLGETWGSGRDQALQLGTEVFRDHVHPQIWIWATEYRIYKMWKDGILDPFNDLLVIADVRFDNEAEWIRLNGGEVFHTTYTGQKNEHERAAAHRSEAGIASRYVTKHYVSSCLEDVDKAVEEILGTWYNADAYELRPVEITRRETLQDVHEIMCRLPIAGSGLPDLPDMRRHAIADRAVALPKPAWDGTGESGGLHRMSKELHDDAPEPRG
jgi:hypothetical protein